MKLIAVQAFTDKQGNQHQANESFEVKNDSEAQEYIRSGQAKAAEGSGRSGSESTTR